MALKRHVNGQGC